MVGRLAYNSINVWVQIPLNSYFVADPQYFFPFIYSGYFLFFLYLYVRNRFASSTTNIAMLNLARRDPANHSVIVLLMVKQLTQQSNG